MQYFFDYIRRLIQLVILLWMCAKVEKFVLHQLINMEVEVILILLLEQVLKILLLKVYQNYANKFFQTIF